MVDLSNAWPNYYAGFLWLIVFLAFVLIKYPDYEGRSQS